jgi:uncharacterized OsmC-like protein
MSFRYKHLLEESRRKLDADPDRRSVELSVESRQIDGFRSEVRVRDFTVTIDQPASFGGGNLGPKPSEYVLAALAACQEVTYRLYADALGIALDEVRVHVTGRSNPRGFLGLEDGGAGFEEIRGKVFIKSSASADDLERLKRTVDRHCPVLDDLRSPVTVSLELEREAPSEHSAG